MVTVLLSLLAAVQGQELWVFTVIVPGPPAAEKGTIVPLSGFVVYVQDPGVVVELLLVLEMLVLVEIVVVALLVLVLVLLVMLVLVLVELVVVVVGVAV
jgi:hypothetical protein